MTPHRRDLHKGHEWPLKGWGERASIKGQLQQLSVELDGENSHTLAALPRVVGLRVREQILGHAVGAVIHRRATSIRVAHTAANLLVHARKGIGIWHAHGATPTARRRRG